MSRIIQAALFAAAAGCLDSQQTLAPGADEGSACHALPELGPDDTDGVAVGDGAVHPSDVLVADGRFLMYGVIGNQGFRTLFRSTSSDGQVWSPPAELTRDGRRWSDTQDARPYVLRTADGWRMWFSEVQTDQSRRTTAIATAYSDDGLAWTSDGVAFHGPQTQATSRRWGPSRPVVWDGPTGRHLYFTAHRQPARDGPQSYSAGVGHAVWSGERFEFEDWLLPAEPCGLTLQSVEYRIQAIARAACRRCPRTGITLLVDVRPCEGRDSQLALSVTDGPVDDGIAVDVPDRTVALLVRDDRTLIFDEADAGGFVVAVRSVQTPAGLVGTCDK